MVIIQPADNDDGRIQTLVEDNNIDIDDINKNIIMTMMT